MYMYTNILIVQDCSAMCFNATMTLAQTFWLPSLFANCSRNLRTVYAIRGINGPHRHTLTRNGTICLRICKYCSHSTGSRFPWHALSAEFRAKLAQCLRVARTWYHSWWVPSFRTFQNSFYDMAGTPAPFTHSSRSFTKTLIIGTTYCVALQGQNLCQCHSHIGWI